jgi:hypothetical protein
VVLLADRPLPMTRATIRPMSPDHRAPIAPRRPPRVGFRPSAIAVALIWAIALGGCDTSGPHPPGASASPGEGSPSASPAAASQSIDASGNPDLAATYATIEQQVIAIRGLRPKAPVAPRILDDAGLKKLIHDSFSKDNPPELLAANERIYKALGMLDENVSLNDTYIKLLGSAVAGLYDNDNKQLYVVSRTGRIGPVEKTTFSHEFTHALQDQNFDIGKLQLDLIGEGDRSFARLSLVEGDATLSMSMWQLQHLTQAEQLELITASQSDESTKVVLSMPPILRESLLFPYLQGLIFVQGLQLQGGWKAVDAAFARPPASSEQIVHPEKYAAGEAPLPVDLPNDLAARLGSGWKVGLEDSFGEFQLGVWLKQNKQAGSGQATKAAAGWGGDRVAVLNGAAGTWGVVLRTTWDSAADATDFETVASPIVGALPTPASLLPGAGGTERWVIVGSDQATLGALAGALGLAG